MNSVGAGTRSPTVAAEAGTNRAMAAAERTAHGLNLRALADSRTMRLEENQTAHAIAA